MIQPLGQMAKCEKCGDELERHPNMFYWRGDWKPGYVCRRCNALFVVPGEEIEPLRPINRSGKNE